MRVTVLHNLDDTRAVDVVAVEDCARAVRTALADHGHDVTLAGIRGHDDVFDVLARVRASRADLVFNLCEALAGVPANEPTFAGLLDLFSIPYTGSDLLALASCLYKERTKEILIAHGIATPPHRVFVDPDDLDDAALDALDYPWFCKLAREDASVGITEANDAASAAALRARARELIAEYRQPVLAERYVAGREINVTMLGNGASVEVLPLHEIDFAAMPADRPRIVSYAAKWDDGHVDYAGTKPVPLREPTPPLVAAVEATARAAYRALGLRDYGRVDLRVDAAGAPWVIDVNPNCDLSPDAGFPRAARAAGISYPQLIDRIARIALQRLAR
jgi:D-alanine-D-alanine ligase